MKNLLFIILKSSQRIIYCSILPRKIAQRRIDFVKNGFWKEPSPRKPVPGRTKVKKSLFCMA
jgi:hypothetical protein